MCISIANETRLKQDIALNYNNKYFFLYVKTYLFVYNPEETLWSIINAVCACSELVSHL